MSGNANTSVKGSFFRSRGVRKKPFLWFAGILAVIILVKIGYAPFLRGTAAFLITEDDLEPAVAIVVLAGHLPVRAMEAADLYHKGWSQRIVLARVGRSQEQLTLKSLGVVAPEEWQLNREVLIRLGVPPAAIFVAEGEKDGTLGELQIVERAIKPEDSPVIFVTSKCHTRRVRLSWNYITDGRSKGVVRATTYDHFDPKWWWKDRGSILAVVREYLGLLNYLMGYPVK